MKFIHTSDIHYGMVPDPTRTWSHEREQAIKDSFDRMVRECKNERADMLLISGDFFHGQPTNKELNLVNGAFNTIPDTKVVIVAGTDDYIIEGSPITEFEWADNVTYVKEEELTKIDFNNLGVSVYARSCHRANGFGSKLSEFPVLDDSKINILMTYGIGPEDLPYDQEEAQKAKFSYVALGGWHKPWESLEGVKAIYPGSPEPVSIADTGKHGYFITNIDEETGEVTTNFITIPGVRYLTLIVNVTPSTTNLETVESLKTELVRRGERNIYKLRIKGSCKPEVKFDLNSLKDTFRIVDISDETEPKYDYSKLFAEHPSDIIGFFVQKLNHEDSSQMEKRALGYGINALLKTAAEGENE